MRKNTRRVYEAWREFRLDTRDRSVWTNGQTVYSYGTAILTRYGLAARVGLNVTPYSVTTTAHQSGLLDLLRQDGTPVLALHDLSYNLPAAQLEEAALFALNWTADRPKVRGVILEPAFAPGDTVVANDRHPSALLGQVGTVGLVAHLHAQSRRVTPGGLVRVRWPGRDYGQWTRPEYLTRTEA